MISEAVRSLFRRAIASALGRGARWKASLDLSANPPEEKLHMANEVTSASEALVAMPLADMLKSLGLAVAAANKAMSEVQGPQATVMTVNKATIELNIAVSVTKSEDVKVGGALALQAFNVNASYARAFGFKEEASSRISIEFGVVTPRA